MSKHKNLLLMLFALVLFIYAGILSVYPYLLNLTFNTVKFEEKAYTASGLRTSLDNIEFKMQPNLTLVITLRNLSLKYIDYQDCFDAGFIELKTGAFSPITKKFPIKNMLLRHVKFSDQMLMPQQENKLAYLPRSFNVNAFDTKKIVIGAGPVFVYDFEIKRIAPGFYKEDNRKESSYSKNQVKEFLSSFNMEQRNIYIK